jgi:hypothetical protein
MAKRTDAPSASRSGELAAVPPAEFIRARNALAARLRKAGRGTAAAQVKARKRPTIPVWIVNRLAHDDRRTIEQLIRVTDRMKAAQLGRGGGRRELADAIADQRAALRELLDRAERLLREAGASASHAIRLRIENTLIAAAADSAERRALRDGALDRELTPRGFDVFGGARPLRTRSADRAVAPADARPSDRAPKAPPGESPAVSRRRVEVASAREARLRAESQAAVHRDRVTAAERRVAELHEALQRARHEADQARRESRQASKAQRGTEQAARRAERALAAAERAPSEYRTPDRRGTKDRSR